MEHAKHIWRAVLLLLIGLAAFVVVRHFLVPKSFGEYGHYRWDNLGEQADKPMIHGGRESCKGCHKDAFETVMKGRHAAVNCEVCHAPLSTHVVNGERIGEMRRPREKDEIYRLCAQCHQKLAGRPSDGPNKFPQVVLAEHHGKNCRNCHDPHKPTPER